MRFIPGKPGLLERFDVILHDQMYAVVVTDEN